MVDVGMCSPFECSNLQSARDHCNCNTAEAPWGEHALAGSMHILPPEELLQQLIPCTGSACCCKRNPTCSFFLNSRHVDPWPSLEISFTGGCRGTRCSACSGSGHARQHPRSALLPHIPPERHCNAGATSNAPQGQQPNTSELESSGS